MILSQRLILRQLELTDAPFIITLLNTAGWLQYIGNRHVRTIEDAERYITHGPAKSYRDNGFGLLLVTEREQGTPIGICGLLKRENLDHPDLGFAFLPEYTGKGYAYEASIAVLNYGQESLKIDTVAAITLQENIASVKLLEKLGFLFTGKTRSDDGREELYLFIRKREA